MVLNFVIKIIGTSIIAEQNLIDRIFKNIFTKTVSLNTPERIIIRKWSVKNKF